YNRAHFLPGDYKADLDGITIIYISLGFVILAVFILFVTVLYRLKRNKHFREKENMELSFQKTLLQSQLEIQEQTLKNISQEIHDNIGQVLSLAKLNLFTMNPDQPDLLNQKIQDSRELVSKAI